VSGIGRSGSMSSPLGGQGPNLGGVNLVYCDDFDQIRCFPRLPSAHSVHRAKALRSGLELAIAQATTKSFSASDDVVDLQLKKTTHFLSSRWTYAAAWNGMPCYSSLMLNRCALHDCRCSCDGLGYTSAILPRLSRMLLPPHAAHWP
jgi:hypothetical protein